MKINIFHRRERREHRVFPLRTERFYFHRRDAEDTEYSLCELGDLAVLFLTTETQRTQSLLFANLATLRFYFYRRDAENTESHTSKKNNITH